MPDAFRAFLPLSPRAVRICRGLRASALAFLLAGPLTSCAFFRHRSRLAATGPSPDGTAAASVPSAAGNAPVPHRVGIVRVIGTAQRFVLIEVPSISTASLPDGQLLRCAADPSAGAAATATLRVARERRRPFVVADVVTGEPHVGDTVFAASTPPPAAASGPMVLPTATSGVLPIVLPGGTPAPDP